MDYNETQDSDDSEDTQEGNDNTQRGSESKTVLEKYAEAKNLCDKLDEEELNNISSKVLYGYTEDKTSQAQWLSEAESALKLARLTKEPKNTPLPQSANIKYPMIAAACHQFAARTYPELIQDGKIVKAEIVGQSSPMIDMIAYGVSTHMSHQLLGSDSSWEAGMDTLLTVLPNIGFVCKKTYYDSLTKTNVSDVCFYKDIILRNDPSISSLKDFRRITHKLHVHPNDLVENCRAGLYAEDTVYKITEFYSQSTLNPDCTLLEQHRFLDLDKDGYEEPYIVTVHEQTNKVLRIVARYTKDDIEYTDKNEVLRIHPIQYFTDYHFLPAPDGSFLSVGFGSLLLHMNETVNSILNQLIDAGTLANLQTGFIDSRIKIMGGQTMVDPGSWTRVKAVIGQQLKDGMLPINYKEPSSVLYQLLGLLIQSSKELTSSTDAMQGMQNATNVPATSMLAMIEQGMKMFSAIQRRLYRALKEEYQKIYRLNGLYLDEEDYTTVLGPDYQHLPNIYKTKAIKVIPIADPNLSSDAQRMAQSQAIMALAGRPGINNSEIYMRYLQSIKVSNPEKIVSQDPQAANPPDPKAIEMQAKAQAKQAEVQIKGRAQALKEKEFSSKLAKMDAEITQMQANSLKLVAQAKAEHHGMGIDEHNAQLETMKAQIQSVAQAHAQLTQQHQADAQLGLRQQELNQQHQQAGVGLQQNQQDLDQTHQREQASIENDKQSGQDNSGNADGMDKESNNPGNA